MRKFAVFDIDGTLIRWQLYHAVVDKIAKAVFIDEKTYQNIKQARLKWKNRQNQNDFYDYQNVVVQGFETALQKIPPKEFDHAVSEVISVYKDQVYTYSRDLIANLKNKNYFLIAISGSQEELVKQISEYYQFDIYVGSDYKQINGKFSGEKFIASLDKQKLLKQIINKYNLSTVDSVAVGDTKSDASVLELVDRPIAFNPDNELYKIAKNNKWDIVVERKNVVYKLNYKHSGYILA